MIIMCFEDNNQANGDARDDIARGEYRLGQGPSSEPDSDIPTPEQREELSNGMKKLLGALGMASPEEGDEEDKPEERVELPARFQNIPALDAAWMKQNLRVKVGLDLPQTEVDRIAITAIATMKLATPENKPRHLAIWAIADELLELLADAAKEAGHPEASVTPGTEDQSDAHDEALIANIEKALGVRAVRI